MSKTVVVGQIPGGLLPYSALVTDTVTGEQALAPIVFPGNPADGTFAGDPATVAFINTYFACLHNFTGATVGDLIVEVVQYDTSTSPATVTSTVWLNATLGTTLAGPPLATNLTYMGGAGLTDAQLRATPVPVSTAQLAATLGAAAAASSPSVTLSTENAALLANLTAIAANLAPMSHATITTSTTTLVNSGASTLGKVVINTKGTVASTVTIYNALTATGTPIAIIDSLNLSGTFEYDIALSTGITVVTTGAPNITVCFR